MGGLSIAARLRLVGRGRPCRRGCILARRTSRPVIERVSYCFHDVVGKDVYTRSSVFFALSETKGSAIGGIESDAGMVNGAKEL